MVTCKFVRYSGLVGLTTIALVDAAPLARADAVQTIYTFEAGEALGLIGSLLPDSAGNLYGANLGGGGGNSPSVFELSPPEAGTTAWTKKTLYSFKTDADSSPDGALVMDASGDLYGTGDGLDNRFVYELSPPAAGHTVWSEKLLHVSAYPGKFGVFGALAIDAKGNLYGTWASAPPYAIGGVFEMSPPAAGKTAWNVAILHQFSGTDGNEINSGLLFGRDGSLYGTTPYGGSNNKGTVFQLTPPAAGHTVWTEKVLYNFEGYSKGSYPVGSLVEDSSGALYGNLVSVYNEPGVIFKLTPPAAGHTVWTESIIYKFSEQVASAGLNPVSNLVFDSSGALYGQTELGGAYRTGVLFKLTPPPTGTARWTETVLMNLRQPGARGLATDQNGNIFGYSGSAGTVIEPTVFEITP